MLFTSMLGLRTGMSVVVDLGSHIGLAAALQFKAAFPRAEIHCCEPNPSNCCLLRLNTGDLAGVFLHQEAAGGHRGRITFLL